MEAVIAQAFETVPMGPSAGLGTTLDTVRDDTEDTARISVSKVHFHAFLLSKKLSSYPKDTAINVSVS